MTAVRVLSLVRSLLVATKEFLHVFRTVDAVREACFLFAARDTHVRDADYAVEFADLSGSCVHF